uniref:Tubulin-folding cofactor B n=1 Tax=Hadrurus spadix TaxID=141984 RepID=A0A1W7R9B3_9SCOR
MADENTGQPSMVNVLITSSINSFGTQRRFPDNILISDLKNKLELLTGATAAAMTLQLLDKNNKLITELENDATLGSYSIAEGMRIHVLDQTHEAGEFEDTSKVKKFVLSEDEYDKKSDSVRAYKMREKLGQFNKEEVEKIAMEQKKREIEEETLVQTMSVGNRCEVAVKGRPTRRGTIAYVGKVDFKPGYWVGIQYDEPFGKNDGSVNGKQYFTCTPKYGGFVKPHDVTVGNFPPEDLNLDDEI